MEWSHKISTAPASEPVTTAEAKEHLRITHSEEDTYIDRLITMAREWAEAFTSRGFINQTWVLKLAYFPSVILLPRSPVSSITSIAYVDTAGSSQTLASSVYASDTNQEPGTIREAYGQSWPAIRSQSSPLPVTVTYVAGYGTAASSVPASIRQAILVLIGTSYEFREDLSDKPAIHVPEAAERLLWPYRTWWEQPWR